MPKKRSVTKLVAYGLIVLVLLFFCAELGYRLFLKKKYAAVIAEEISYITYNYRVCASMHVEYDSKYGEHPKPSHECYFTAITDGKVSKGTEVFKSNKDSLDGRTTLEEYRNADYKILMFGDSYVHWNQAGDTWPDLLQNNLNALKGKKVAILNFARGAYGLMQMLDLAADKIPELKPDLAIFGVGKGNIANGRWWSYETKENGYTRWIISAKNGEDKDYWYTSDLTQVTEGTTPEWCRKQIETPSPNDPVLKKANAQFMAMETKKIRDMFDVPLTSWGHSFLLRKLFKKSPFEGKEFIPHLTINDFADDARGAQDIEKINAAKTKLLLLFIPTMAEVQKPDSVFYDKQKQNLLASLEKGLKTPFRFLQKEYKGPVPAVIDLRPLDMHPNHDGLQFYADAATSLVRKIIEEKP